MISSITSKKKRDEMRQLYDSDDLKLILTQRDIEDPDSDEDSDSDESDEELQVEISESD